MSDAEDDPELKQVQEDAKKPESQEEEAEGEEEVPGEDVVPVESVPLWCNLRLPKQGYSWTADAAYQTRFAVTHVPMPQWLGKKRKEDAEPKYKVAACQQTAQVYDAYQALGIVTVPHTPTELTHFLAAEKTELQAAVGKGDPPDSATAKPRRCAITVLIPHSPTCSDRALLLDCMAMLSRANHMGSCAMQETRMAVLADQDAIVYAQETGGRVYRDRSFSAELVLTWATEEEGRRRFVYVPLKVNTRAQVMYKTLTMAIANAFSQAGLPLPSALGRSSELNSERIDGAYAKGLQEVNDEFWTALCDILPPPALDFKLNFGPTGNVEHRIFLKIVPFGIDLMHPEVYFGMLLYEKGKEQVLYDYAVGAMQEERGKVNEGDDALIGLRPPLTTREGAARPHILTVRASVVSFRNRVSAFGIKSAPGYQVSQYDHASLPKIVFELVPYTDAFTHGKFVFPCMQEDTDSLDDKLALSQCHLSMDAVRAYADLCDLDEEARGTPLRVNAPKDSVFSVKKFKGKKLKGESAVVANMSGVALGGAFRLGEVLERIENSKQTMPVMRAFLTSSIARLGRNAPMVEALNLAANLDKKWAEEVKALNDKVSRLDSDLLHQQTATKRAAAAAAAIEPCSLDAMQFCLDGMKLTALAGSVIKIPFTKNRAHGVANVVARAHGERQEQARATAETVAVEHWQSVKEMPIAEAAAYIAQKVYGCPIYIVFVHKDDERVDFLKAKQPAGRLEKVSPMAMYDAPKRDNPILMLKFVEKLNKLFALCSS